ncbi:uncharacterized protein LOC131855207 [Achroia grisella]|uniref:uncharacterized protein LOC131855207 n=1 Tax=Achroia grisella TaxID=688607 RepID=UPI0027D31309|nr:uncharacterized protein LOC131855207 [Achroia grisella]
MCADSLWANDRTKTLNNTLSSDKPLKSPTVTPRSLSPSSKIGEAIFHKYIDIINSKSNISLDAKKTEPCERPFDFFDDEEFAFGINLLNNNVACVGDNITKLIQMAQEPWPDNVKLFQPYEVEQILLPDNASCLAVQAFLKMCNLPFEVEMRWNAEFMSPSGRVPFIKCGAFVVSELEPIVQFAANKGVSLCGRLSTEEKAEMRAYMSLITNVLVNAELYISWLDDDTYNAVTKVRNSSVYPWPLGWLQTRAKRNTVSKRLKALHWQEKTLEQVLSDVEQCCNSLSQRLGDRDYFFGTPSPVDALVYGHIRALLSATGPKAALLIKPITTSLLRHIIRMTNLIGMKLTPQEEYLTTQAFQLSRRRLSPDRTISERSTRTRRSRLCLRNPSRDSVSRDMFGFKPFASKQITIMTSKEGSITCEYDNPNRNEDLHRFNFIIGIIDDIIDKVYELTVEELYGKDFKHDFEIVAHPINDDSIEIDKVNDYLDTIEESDMNDTTVSMESGHDEYIDIDSDGLINDKMLDSAMETVQDDCSDLTGSRFVLQVFLDLYKSNTHTKTKNEGPTEIYVTKSDSDDRISVIDMSQTSRTPLSTGSNTTLKVPSNEEISVERFLKYLRKRNAVYHLEMAELD